MKDHQLPLAYTPFSLETIETGRTYGMHDFVVTQASHDKAVSLLLGNMERQPSDPNPYPLLLPSELWAMARVFALSFGRLNEVGLARTSWGVYSSMRPSAPLRASAKVIGTMAKGKLAFCVTNTDTVDTEGTLLMQARDTILLVHDCPKPFFLEPTHSEASVPGSLLYRNRHKVYFRWPWDPAVWHNNIHVDAYARLCGFDSGLPEFVVYMDWIYHAVVQCHWIKGEPFSIHVKKLLPMYLGDVIDVIAYETGSSLQVRLLRHGMDRMTATICRNE